MLASVHPRHFLLQHCEMTQGLISLTGLAGRQSWTVPGLTSVSQPLHSTWQMLRSPHTEVLRSPRFFVFLPAHLSPGKAGRLKFAKISPSSGLAEILQSSVWSEKNNGATAGAALPCSETPVAPHCLRSKVQTPSLEFERRHNQAPPCLSDLIVGGDLLPGQAQLLPARTSKPSPAWYTCLACAPAHSRPPPHPCLEAQPPSRLSSKAPSSRKTHGPFNPP